MTYFICGGKVSHLSFPIWKYTGPGQRKSEHLDAQVLHDGYIVLIQVVKVVCCVSSVPVVSLAWEVGKCVPDAGFSPVLVY